MDLGQRRGAGRLQTYDVHPTAELELLLLSPRWRWRTCCVAGPLPPTVDHPQLLLLLLMLLTELLLLMLSQWQRTTNTALPPQWQ